MKNFLSKTCLFALVSCFIYIAIIVILGLARVDISPNIIYTRASHGYLLTRLQEADSCGKVDILCLGSSHAYRGFDNRIFTKFGFSSFNLGSSAQTPAETELVLHRYIERMSPKIVIFEVYPTTFELDGTESTIDLISNLHPNTTLLTYALKTHNPIIYNSAIYSFTRNIRVPLRYYKQNLETKSDKYISGGFVEKKDTSFHSPLYLKQSHTFEFRQNNIDAFERIISFLKSKNIKVVLVQAPLSAEMNNKIANKEEIDSFFKRFEGENLKYVTYNSMDKRKFQMKSLFYDGSHLNQKGVELFNTHFIHNYLLSDKYE